MRLQGYLISSEYGIESLVDIDEFSTRGAPVKDKTIVDYIYFSTQDPAYHHVIGAPSWLKLDNRSNTYNNQTHHDLYEVNDLI